MRLIPHDAPVCEPIASCSATSATPSRISPVSIRSTNGACRPGWIVGRRGDASVYMIVPVVAVLPSALRKSSKKSRHISTTPPQTSRKSSRRWSKRRRSAAVPKPANVSSKKAMMARWQARERHGACALWDGDGTGFCFEPYLPDAWPPRGTSLQVPTSSQSRRLHVCGFLKRNNDLHPYMIEGSVDTAVIIECFAQLREQLDKRSSVLLDNAPMHRSKACMQQMPKWVR